MAHLKKRRNFMHKLTRVDAETGLGVDAETAESKIDSADC